MWMIRHRIVVMMFMGLALSARWPGTTRAQEPVESAFAPDFLTRLCQGPLGQNPAPACLRSILGEVEQDGSVVPIVLALFHSQEFLSLGISDAQFLTICYQFFLGRDPDMAGFDALLADIQGGRITRDNLLDIFMDSQEFSTQVTFLPPIDPLTAFVTNLYIRILGRGPDSAGREVWVSELRQTRQALLVVQAFLASVEFQRRSTMTNTEFVALLYSVFLNRVPDPAGLIEWIALLDQRIVTRDQLVIRFATSPEFHEVQRQMFPSGNPAAQAFVTRLYREVLNREPDATGLQVFLGQIDQCFCVDLTVIAFFHSPELLRRNTTDEQFVTILYRALLIRDPNPADIAGNLVLLQAGFTRDNLLDRVLDSREFTQTTVADFLPPLDPLTAYVSTLYVRVLGRAPDQAGLQGFVAKLEQMRTVLPTVQALLTSPEFLARNTSNAEFVTALYWALLGRPPGPPESLASWVAVLDQGTLTRDQLVLEFAASEESRAFQQHLFQ